MRSAAIDESLCCESKVPAGVCMISTGTFYMCKVYRLPALLLLDELLLIEELLLLPGELLLLPLKLLELLLGLLPMLLLFDDVLLLGLL